MSEPIKHEYRVFDVTNRGSLWSENYDPAKDAQDLEEQGWEIVTVFLQTHAFGARIVARRPR